MNLAYIAGIIDGEGCIGFTRCRTYVYPRLQVTNTNKELLEDLRERFGGDIKPMSLRKDNWKQGWSWRLCGSKCVNLIDKVSPWLRIKVKQSILVFCWDAIRLGQGRRTQTERDSYLDAVDLIIAESHWLNINFPRPYGRGFSRCELRSVASPWLHPSTTMVGVFG